MARHIVAEVGEIPPGERKLVEVAGRSIGVFNLGGEFFALRNRCPHQGGPLCLGKVFGLASAAVPGAVEYTRPGEILTCAWHGWEFDIRTGHSWCDPQRLRVRRYDVTVAPGADLLASADVDSATPGGPAIAPDPEPEPSPDPNAPIPGHVRGPYAAETFPVSVDGQYVVVEMPG